jgi:hypothetical protein
MFTGIFSSVVLMALVVYTSVVVSTFFADRTNKKIDAMTDRLNELDPDCPICKTEKDDA